jgi:hypothetical protein
MSNSAKPRKLLNIADAPDKSFRLDCLLQRVGDLVLAKVEDKIKLPGLKDAISPIMEDEIRKHIPPDKVVPKKYEKLARMAGKNLGVA